MWVLNRTGARRAAWTMTICLVFSVVRASPAPAQTQAPDTLAASGAGRAPNSGATGFGPLGVYVAEAIHPGVELTVYDPEVGLVLDVLLADGEPWGSLGVRHQVSEVGSFIGAGAGMVGAPAVYAEIGAAARMGAMFSMTFFGRGYYTPGEGGGLYPSFGVSLQFHGRRAK